MLDISSIFIIMSPIISDVQQKNDIFNLFCKQMHLFVVNNIVNTLTKVGEWPFITFQGINSFIVFQ